MLCSYTAVKLGTAIGSTNVHLICYDRKKELAREPSHSTIFPTDVAEAYLDIELKIRRPLFRYACASKRNEITLEHKNTRDILEKIRRDDVHGELISAATTILKTANEFDQNSSYRRTVCCHYTSEADHRNETDYDDNMYLDKPNKNGTDYHTLRQLAEMYLFWSIRSPMKTYLKQPSWPARLDARAPPRDWRSRRGDSHAIDYDSINRRHVSLETALGYGW